MSVYDCTRVLELLDYYMDRELSPAEMAAVERHLEECVKCRGELSARTALRDRLRVAARKLEAPRELANRVRRPKRQPVWIPLALAAAILLATGVGIMTRRLSPVMRVGLDQHLHCAVPRTYRNSPHLELKGEYASVIPIVEQHTINGLRVVMAHRCELRGRIYIHVIMQGSGRLASLLITKRRATDDFGNGLIHSASADGYNIAGFETSGWLVYMVSDVSEATNMATLEAMSPQLLAVLKNL